MASCTSCSRTIVFGGVRDGGFTYCSKRCQARNEVGVIARDLPEEEVRLEAESVHEGQCPQCGGPGPVDVHVSHTVWSALVVSNARSTPAVCCASCGTKARWGAALSSAVLGWWGFPWGLVLTPIQIARNIGGLRGPDPRQPSPLLIERVRHGMAIRQSSEEPPPASAGALPMDGSGEAPYGASTIDAPAAPIAMMAPTHATQSRQGRSVRSWASSFAVVMLLIGGGYLAVAALKTPMCWLVNGLDRPYNVTVDGVSYRLPPHARKRIDLPKGSIEVVVNDPSLDIAPQTARIESPFLMRPVRNEMFVLNPDRTAVILWEQAVYTARPASNQADTSHLSWVGLLSTFKGIDFPFVPLPDKIETSNRVERRERISLANKGVSSAMLAFWMEAEHGRDAAAAWLMRRATLDADDIEAARALSRAVEPNAFKTFARSRLEDRPVRVEWHRVYQEATDDTASLVAEYRRGVEREPDNADLMYLLGCVLDDPDEEQAMLLRATAVDPPSPHAHAALAYKHLIAGRFEEARAEMDKGVELAPSGKLDSFQSVRNEIHHALGDYDELLTSAAKAQANDPTDIAAVNSQVYYLARLGRDVEAHHQINAYVRAAEREGATAAAQRHSRAMLELTLATARGDVDEFIRIARTDTDLGYASDAELLEGDAAGAAILIDEVGTWQPAERFMVYCVASLGDQPAVAGAELAKALELVGELEDPAWLRVARWFETGTAPSEQEIQGLSLPPAQKRVALLALGCRFTEDRQRHWFLARSLNYDRRWPYLSVRMVLDGGIDHTSLAP